MAVMRMNVLLPLSLFASAAAVLLADKPAKKTEFKLPPEAYALSPEARARHALNRLAFGPRPGEVARLAQPGALEGWISAQLDPESLSDADYRRRLQNLPLATLTQD